ncbi:hypothetical protein B4U80_06970 [Leptotrombidium deliense]|uniref:Uncharacterized protein n=1 Tax=Leptotrombidium deliense TaxID=299467 RepID=A0A443SKS7_9ACAR|nr:hypothetical protein B4U80_06970 [Leptotrombidium deliense]
MNQEIISHINKYYRQVNIEIVLVNVFTWKTGNKIKITKNSTATLYAFTNYLKKEILKRGVKLDNLQLLTAFKFEGDLAGKAHRTTICNIKRSVSINNYNPEDFNHVLLSTAHEMAHNFGLRHDSDNCMCSRKDVCVMYPYIANEIPTEWSDCSIREFRKLFQSEETDCLLDVPVKAKQLSSLCGNGLVEEGEQCDCPTTIDNKQTACSRCCNNCTLRTGAECGSGICCDFNTCKVFKQKKRCRIARSSECDIEEYCDGKSEFCPRDAIVHDGNKCRGGFCYSGRCTTNDQQCKSLWGNDARAANQECYNNNVYGDESGNCGFDVRSKQYIKCREEDKRCGLLQCHTDVVKKIDYPKDYYTTTPARRAVFANRRWSICQTLVVEFEPNEMTSISVPNGNECGDDKMCVEGRCVHRRDILNKNKCRNDCRGLCSNDGVCCYDGTQGIDCSGNISVTSNTKNDQTASNPINNRESTVTSKTNNYEHSSTPATLKTHKSNFLMKPVHSHNRNKKS